MARTDRHIHITDTFRVVPSVPAELKDFILSSLESRRYRKDENYSAGVRSLRVRIEATHSGKRTRNNTLYLPEKMKKSTPTWTTPFGKPILLHHDKYDDAIGRIIGSGYMDTSGDLQDSFKDFLTDFNLLVEGTKSVTDAVDVVNRLAVHDASFLDPNWRGLGFMELHAMITSPDAIQKILDKRYLTGSVGMTSNSAVCSVCKKDWVQDDMCEHQPGKDYEGKVCILIIGDLVGEEYSFVNKPADMHSGVVEILTNGVVEKFSASESSDNVQEVCLTIGAMEDSMADTESTPVVPTDTQPPADPPAPVSQDPVEAFWGTDYADLVGDDPWGREYAEMLYEFVKEFPETEKDIRDKKLTAAERKKMSSKSFCGPGRSFPVGDCPHYSAALRMLGRYKGPGDKGRIKACIMRKGTRLGCTSKKEDSVDVGQFTAEWFDQLEDSELPQLYAGLLVVASERKVTLPVEDVTTKLQTTEQALAVMSGDLQNLTEQLVAKTKLVTQKTVDFIAELLVLKGELKTTDEKQSWKDTALAITQEDLDSHRDRLLNEVDTFAVVDRLNSGLAKNVSKPVDDPTLKQEQTLNANCAPEHAMVAVTYRDILKRMGIKKAEMYLKSLKDAQRIPADFVVQGG